MCYNLLCVVQLPDQGMLSGGERAASVHEGYGRSLFKNASILFQWSALYAAYKYNVVVWYSWKQRSQSGVHGYVCAHYTG